MNDVEINEKEADVMRHALGIQKRGGEWSAPYRNYFSTSPWSDDDQIWKALWERGLARAFSRKAEQKNNLWAVTEKGKKNPRLKPGDIEDMDWAKIVHEMEAL